VNEFFLYDQGGSEARYIIADWTVGKPPHPKKILGKPMNIARAIHQANEETRRVKDMSSGKTSAPAKAVADDDRKPTAKEPRWNMVFDSDKVQKPDLDVVAGKVSKKPKQGAVEEGDGRPEMSEEMKRRVRQLEYPLEDWPDIQDPEEEYQSKRDANEAEWGVSTPPTNRRIDYGEAALDTQPGPKDEDLVRKRARSPSF
jgi:hypothetical protein